MNKLYLLIFNKIRYFQLTCKYGDYEILAQRVFERDLSCDGISWNFSLTHDHQFELVLTENILIDWNPPTDSEPYLNWCDFE